ncbi:MAG TPA: tRNA (adenosine(37)-N6)-threonylcarbamoyltransferase complex ATPase subunit type 1 TsaE [Chitinophagaceae bacterium]|nr:tRNA (adenosine(37)-N6)-threonylcarbamoyltransferase complex ATPase subunit type 1 TsaE [Chitinophagaceae bacterium]
MQQFSLASKAQLDEAAKWVLSNMSGRKILLLEGQLGAGKTTLCAAICRELGSDDVVNSPTFSIIQEYSSPGGPIYHIDLYRTKDTAEVYDTGIEDILHSGHICLIEWPEKILPLLPDPYAKLTIHINQDERLLELEQYG